MKNNIQQANEILSQAFDRFDKIAVSWSGGKDSTAVLFMARKFNVNIPVIVTDTYCLFEETYAYIEKMAKLYSLNLHYARAPKNRAKDLLGNREQCCTYHKTKPFLGKVKELNLDAVIVGIRRDEHPSRSKEKHFSRRKDHWRVHPILDWSERDVWNFLNSNKIPMNPLYKKGYRSIGCKPCTVPVPKGKPERYGRSQDKEAVMEKLRKLGYF